LTVHKKWIITLLLVSAAVLLGACGGTEGVNSEAVLTEAARIALEGLTQTAEAAPPTPTETPVPPTPTETPVPPTNTPTTEAAEGEGSAAGPTATAGQPASGGGGGAGCYRANFETETIPDGTKFYPDKIFTKTWRLKNVGSCTWGANFSIVWVQGDLIGAESVVLLTEQSTPPGGYIMAEVEMQAPAKAGIYKGYWMLRSTDGVLFGTDADGKGTVWVEIEVLPDPDE
jgi:hypothetical protein